MKLRQATTCANCERLAKRVAKLEAQVLTLVSKRSDASARIAKLEAENSQLREQLAKLRKNSSTSSKPPSSDIVKPRKPAPKDGKKRKRGGQPGHPRHDRPPFTPEQIDQVYQFELNCCPDCGGSLQPSDAAPRVIQQVEIIEKPVRIEEHRAGAYWCPHCRKVHYAPLPSPLMKAGLLGPRLTALVAFMKGVCHASFSTIRKFLRDVAGVKISRGQLAKLIAKVSEALSQTYRELFEGLPGESVLNIDETGHKENGKRFWTWCFRAELYTLFGIRKSRGSKVLIEVLGRQFNGVLGCDYFSAYRKYMRDFDVLVQFCLAHLIRDVKFLMTLPARQDRAYGRRLRDGLRELFGVVHRRDQMTGAAFQTALQAARQRVLTAATTNVPDSRKSQNLAKRFRQHGEAYFQFITTPGIEPTNNLAEQAIRFVVIDRRITQGTRSEVGRQWCERIWTVIATCTQQGRSIFEFIHTAVLAHFNSTLPPSLLAQPP